MNESKGNQAGTLTKSEIIAKIATVFLLGYGLHYLGYFIRARYFTWLDTLSLDEGIAHCFGYLGHVIFLTLLFIYAWAVKSDKKYVLSFCKGDAGRNLKYALAGAALGFLQMGICVFAAVLNGNLVIGLASNVNYAIFIFALLCVLIQASTEEIESRGFVFGKMNNEGVPLAAAVLVSSFYFSYLHAANPGFGLLPLLSIFVVGVEYSLFYYYYGTLWLPMTMHTLWNYTQDFIFGLPDSGKPAAASIFSTEVNGSSFFYDKDFGIEGSWMAIIVNVVFCLVMVLIAKKMKAKEQSKEQK